MQSAGCGMNNDNITACFAKSIAGHDKGTVYSIIKYDGQYVYLSDGRLKKNNCPKKKKVKHIQIIRKVDNIIANEIENGRLPSDEQIKFAIKLLLKEMNN